LVKIVQKKVQVLNINGIEYPLHIFIEHRNGVRCSITKKSINIRIPILFDTALQTSEIQKMIDWAENKIRNRKEIKIKRNAYFHLQEIQLIGITFVLHFHTSSKKQFGEIIQKEIHLYLHSENDFETIEKILYQTIAPYFHNWLQINIPIINQNTINKKIASLSVKNVSSKWGSCSNKGELIFTIRLALKPLWIINYVIIHELCHLEELNHSKRFWHLVSKHFPDYKKAHLFLKT
jgi:predicted metal-dependent hydrolase